MDAGEQGMADMLGGGVDREDDDSGLGAGHPDLPGRFEAIHFRHGNIQDQDVRLQFNAFEDGFTAVGGLSADTDVELTFQEMPEAFADNGVIVAEQD